jgi:hypothetical protein
MKNSIMKAALLGAVLTVAFAGSAMAASGEAADPYLQNRIDNQSERVQNGVDAGTLGERRATVLNKRDALAQQRLDNGHEVAAARTLKKNSHRIYRGKHNQ